MNRYVLKVYGTKLGQFASFKGTMEEVLKGYYDFLSRCTLSFFQFNIEE